jgi:hypothetical protein
VTTEERVQAVADYGFTHRQARFLVLVMRHSGLCVKRQYAAFAGIKPGGEKCNAFFERLVRRGYAVSSDCVHNRARLYHVHHKPLYHSIGEAESRYRRAIPAGRAVERLMRLDAALISPDVEWLTTRSGKLAYLASKTAPASSDSPADTAAHDQRDLFPGTFPIGLDADGRVGLLYVATVPWTDDFRSFLVGHLGLLAVMPAWTLRVVFPPPLRRAVEDYRRAVYEELESRLDPQMLNDLGWYFFHCRRHTDWSEYTGPGGELVKARFARCAKAFAGPRFTRLYRRWLIEDDAALTPVPTTVSEAFVTGRAALDLRVLPHTYDHLSPLVSRRRSHRRRNTADAHEGAGTPRGLNPSPNPGS